MLKSTITGTVLVNMISLFQGGPKTVGLGLMEGMWEICQNYDTTFILVLPSGVGFEELLEAHPHNQLRAIFVRYPFVNLRFLRKLWLDQVYIPWLCMRTDPQLLFMTANFSSLLVARNVRQVVLQHNALYFENPKQLIGVSIPSSIRLALERLLFSICAKKEVHWIVQLECTKARLGEFIGVPESRITTVTMPALKEFCSTVEGTKEMRRKPNAQESTRVVRILFPAKDYPNKNHHLIPDLIAAFGNYGFDAEVYVTLDDDSRILSSLRTRTSPGQLLNLGYSSRDAIAKAYATVDVLFFPSGSESYGFPLVEALVAGIPVLASNLEFVREICGETAFCFIPNLPRTLGAAVEEYLKARQEGWLRKRIEERRKKYCASWAPTVLQIIRSGSLHGIEH